MQWHYPPAVEGLAVCLCVRRSTIYGRRDEHPGFRNQQIPALQASMLVQVLVNA
jgi:hypothetical protein